jgi:hypothetical protein
MNLTQIGAFVLQVAISAGGAAALAVAIIRLGATKWIDHRFNLSLAKFKAERDEELAGVRAKHESDLALLQQKHATELAQINHRLSSRISKIHEKEFEVLPEAWLQVNATFGSVYKTVVGMKSRPQVRRLTKAQLEELILSQEFTPAQRTSILEKTGESQQAALDEAFEHKEVDDATNRQRLLQNYLLQNRIFMTDTLRDRFSAINDDLRTALINYDNSDTGARDLAREAYEILEAVKEKLPPLEQAIQERLHYMEA